MSEANVKEKPLEANVYCLNNEWNALRFAISSIILFAAGMKAWQLATVPSLGEGLFQTRWFNIGVVEFELAFGIWLIFGFSPKPTRLATIVLFTAFTGVSLYKAISGETSCGCFGTAQVNPWFTTILDLSIIGALICCRKVPTTKNQLFSTIRILFLVVLWAMVSVPILHTIVTVEKNTLSALGTEYIGVDGSKTILLEPEKWPSGEFPLLPYIEPIEVREQLKNGEWTVVLYHHDCPKCKQLLTELALKGTSQVVCIEVPPYEKRQVIPIGFVSAKLTDKKNWFVQTPLVTYF